MAKRKTRTVYRDTKTGRFVSKRSWQRSESGRFKRQLVRRPAAQKKPARPAARAPLPPPRPPTPTVWEWIVSFSYSRSGRSMDVIVTASSVSEARTVAKDFLRTDIDGSRIARSGFRGWSATVAKGQPTQLEAGNAEYRSKSRAKRKKRPS